METSLRSLSRSEKEQRPVCLHVVEVRSARLSGGPRTRGLLLPELHDGRVLRATEPILPEP